MGACHNQPLIDGDHRKPGVYVLTAKGATLLATWLDCSETTYTAAVTNGKRLTSSVVAHLLLSNDVRLAIMQAVARSNNTVQLTTWLDEHTLRQAHSKDTIPLETATGSHEQPVPVPDGYFVLHTTQPEAHDYHHFLEVDRSTEVGQSSSATTRDWAGKIQRFQAYYLSGAYQKRYGAQGLRILTVTISEIRLRQLKQITEHIGKTRYWFTTIERILRAGDLLSAPIWQVATKDDSFPLLW